MVATFKEDLAKAKTAEKIVREKLSSLVEDYLFMDVSSLKEFYHQGDIMAANAEGDVRFIEVKDDSKIAETKNVLCEDEVYYKYENYFAKGNMAYDYDIYAVVSQAGRKIYFIDFPILRDNYKKGIFKQIEHSQQTTYCYLVGLHQIKKWGALLGVICY